MKKNDFSETEGLHPGDVIQVDERSQIGYVGALAIITEVCTWGVKASFQMIMNRDSIYEAAVRLPYDTFKKVGRADLVWGD